MLYKIDNFKKMKIYTFRSLPLKLKVIEKDDFYEILINYNGYNLASAMMFWNFREECKYGNIDFKTNVLESKNANTMYFIIDKNILNDFVEEIYCFFMENNMNSLCTEEKKYKKNW